MYKILKKETLAPKIKLVEVDAPNIYAHAAKQFVVLRIHEKGSEYPDNSRKAIPRRDY